MKNSLVVILLLAVVLVVINTGCGGLHRYDGRLVAADSLMQADPDSALALVSAVNANSLVTEGDRAYRDLLMTQARYKAYQDILASDDSAITRAMAWYRAHSGEREKLTRAYLYKGAIVQELGHVDSAMYYYKTAEVTADPKDYANLGQINTRIGTLYQWYYVNPQAIYDKFKKALEYYRLVGNKRLQIDCLFNMAGCEGITHIGDSEQLLLKASMLAVEISDSVNYFRCQELLCRQLSYKGKSVARAKQIALHCLNDYSNYVNHDLLLDLAEIYAYSGMPDSARYYLDLVTENANKINPEQIKTRKYLILSRITQLEGDVALSNHYDMLSHQVSDSVSNNKLKYQIEKLENTFNNQQHSDYLFKISRLQWMMIGFSLFAAIIITMLVIAYMRRILNTKAILTELEYYNPTRINDLLTQFDAKNKAVGHLITNLVGILKACVSESDKQGSSSQLAQQIKETVVDIADDDFWNELRSYLDKEHDNIISKIAKNPGIKKRDLKFIELLCCGFSNVEIAIVMGYAPKYVSRKRKILAQKLGIDQPLQDHLNHLMRKDGSEKDYQKQ